MQWFSLPSSTNCCAVLSFNCQQVKHELKFRCLIQVFNHSCQIELFWSIRLLTTYSINFSNITTVDCVEIAQWPILIKGVSSFPWLCACSKCFSYITGLRRKTKKLVLSKRSQNLIPQSRKRKLKMKEEIIFITIKFNLPRTKQSVVQTIRHISQSASIKNMARGNYHTDTVHPLRALQLDIALQLTPKITTLQA